MKKKKKRVEELLLRGIYALGKSTVYATSRFGGYEPEEDCLAYQILSEKEE